MPTPRKSVIHRKPASLRRDISIRLWLTPEEVAIVKRAARNAKQPLYSVANAARTILLEACTARNSNNSASEADTR